MSRESSNIPLISIVIPCINAAATLDRALVSVIQQGYPRVELIVVDAGSDDGSVDIIRAHDKDIAWWVSEPDSGQANAINKGFAHATGEIVNWLGADDELTEGALEAVAAAFANESVDVVAGACWHMFPPEIGPPSLATPKRANLDLMPIASGVPQPSCFYRRSLLTRQPPLDESYHYAFDTELWNYFKTKGANWTFDPTPLSRFYHSATNKTTTGGSKIVRERERIYRAYTSERIPLTFWNRWIRQPYLTARRRHPGWMMYYLTHGIDAFVARALGLFYGEARVRSMDYSNFLVPMKPPSDGVIKQ